MRSIHTLALASIGAVLPTAAQSNLVEVAQGNGNFSTLLTAATKAGLADLLANGGPFTVFAPTDDAFAKLGKSKIDDLLQPANRDKLAAILKFHVVPGRKKAEDVLASSFLDTALDGKAIHITNDGAPAASGAKIVATDIEATNGIIHVIDRVILPDESTVASAAISNKDFSTLVAAVKAAGLVETLSGPGPFTVFAPTNAAFAKLGEDTIKDLLKPANRSKLASILTYHVVPGRLLAADVISSSGLSTVQGATLVPRHDDGGAYIDGARVLKTNIVVGNGVIHVIDAVVTPRPTIVETAAANASFSTLVTAVQAAGLTDALSGKGPFTVFAPNDAAFGKLPKETLRGLLAKPEELAKILKFHVIPGRVLSTDLPEGTIRPRTLAGMKLQVQRSSNGVRVGKAHVLAADIQCGNGVIHVIDSVVIPK